MGVLFLSVQQLLSNKSMEVFTNPSKRIRLDLNDSYQGNLQNEDDWGKDEITADEFDELEFQATQSHQQDVQTTFLQPILPPSTTTSHITVDESKQQLFELEGKVKILNQSLEKVSAQLKEEKLKRDKIVNEKMLHSITKENELRKEITKIESSLQFKNQEMKSLYEKVHLLETQLKEKKEQSSLPAAQASNSFLEKFQFAAGTSNKKPTPCHENKRKIRKFKLTVDTPRGEIQGTDIISSLLCNRLTMNSSISNGPNKNQHPQFSALSILRIVSKPKTEELFEYFNTVFKNHLNSLKTLKPLGSNSTSPSSIRKKDTKQDKAFVISCLKDLTNIISRSEFMSLMQKYNVKKENPNHRDCEPSTSASNIFSLYKQNHEEDDQKVSSLLHSLALLASPDSYPVAYEKTEEIELSLVSLVSWSTLAPDSFVYFYKETSFQSIMYCDEEIPLLLLSLKLITNLCIHKKFTHMLLHKDDFCLLCTLSSLAMQKVSHDPFKYTAVMLVIEDLLSVLFTIYSFQELELEKSPCSPLILQAIITSLWKFWEKYQEENSDMNLILRKGFGLVELLSSYLPKFKELRASFEDSYISLVSGMLTLLRENPLLNDLHDIIHDLWDFQEDTSEFDLDDPSSEDSSQKA